MLATLVSLSVTSIAYAQTEPVEYIVGSHAVNTSGGTTSPGLHLLSVPFESPDPVTPATLFGSTLPYTSKVYTFTPPDGPYAIAQYVKGVFGNPDRWTNLTDLRGKGFWVELPVGAPSVTTALTGGVNMAPSTGTPIVAGLQLLRNPYPVEKTIAQLNFTPSFGDKIYKFNADGTYSIATYTKGVFGNPDKWSQTPIIRVGEGFWYQSLNDTTWTAPRPF